MKSLYITAGRGWNWVAFVQRSDVNMVILMYTVTG